MERTHISPYISRRLRWRLSRGGGVGGATPHNISISIVFEIRVLCSALCGVNWVNASSKGTPEQRRGCGGCNPPQHINNLLSSRGIPSERPNKNIIRQKYCAWASTSRHRAACHQVIGRCLSISHRRVAIYIIEKSSWASFKHEASKWKVPIFPIFKCGFLHVLGMLQRRSIAHMKPQDFFFPQV